MAAITINIPDAQLQRVIDAFCAEYGWSSVEIDGPRGAFAKKQLLLLIKRKVRSYEEALAVETAVAAARASVADVNPT